MGVYSNKMNKEFTIQIHITNKCQYKCNHCYIKNKNYHEIKLTKFKIIVDKFICFLGNIESKFNIKIDPVFHITGGDPLLHKNIKEILNYIKFYKKAILGNPDTINSETISMLKKYNVFSIQMSLDSLIKNENCRGEDYYLKIKNALMLLRDNKIKTYIMTNVSQSNLNEICDIYKTIDLWGAYKYVFARIVNIGNAKNRFVDTTDYKNMMFDMYNLSLKLKTKLVFKEPLWAQVKNEIGLLNNSKYYIQSCEAGVSLFSIDEHYNIYACRRLPIIIGNILTDDLTDIYLNNPIMKELRFKKNCDGCDINKYCKACPAINYANNKILIQKDVNCWRKEI